MPASSAAASATLTRIEATWSRSTFGDLVVVWSGGGENAPITSDVGVHVGEAELAARG